MVLTALTWPEAVISSVSIFSVALVISVIAWKVLSIGKSAMERKIGRETKGWAEKFDVEDAAE